MLFDGGAFEEPDAAPGRGGGDSMDEARRMDDRGMRGEQRASSMCGGAVPTRFVGVEPSVVIVAESERGVLGELGAKALDLR